MIARGGRARAVVRAGALAYLVALGALAAAATVPVLFGWRANLITSGSMRPALRPGTVLLTAHADPADLRRGDIVLVADPADHGRRYAHRVVGRRSNGRLVTRGDALAHPDAQPVGPEAVVGVARLAVPLVGRPALWARQGHWAPFAGWSLVTLSAVALIAVPRRRAPLS